MAVCGVLTTIVGDDLAAFESDVRTQWAVEMGLIRIGEAVNRIPAEVLARFPDRPGGRSSRCAMSQPISTTTSSRAASGAPPPRTCLRYAGTWRTPSCRDSDRNVVRF